MLESMRQLYKEIQLLKEYTDIETDELEKTADAIEREVEERYVELPKDANGKQVSIGDMVHDHEEGYDFRVDGFMLWENTTEWWAFQDQAVQQKLKNCSVVKPPTVEDVLREFAEKWGDMSYGSDEERELFAEYAKRLQLREE